MSRTAVQKEVQLPVLTDKVLVPFLKPVAENVAIHPRSPIKMVCHQQTWESSKALRNLLLPITVGRCLVKPSKCAAKGMVTRKFGNFPSWQESPHKISLAQQYLPKQYSLVHIQNDTRMVAGCNAWSVPLNLFLDVVVIRRVTFTGDNFASNIVAVLKPLEPLRASTEVVLAKDVSKI